MKNQNEESIKKIIDQSYIQGIHITQNESIIKRGFHSDFNMLVLADNKIVKVTIDQWLKRIEKMKEENPDLWNSKTTYDFVLLDSTHNTAVAKIDVYKDIIHFSTDYMLFYKFDEGWKIVSKVYSVPTENGVL